AIVPVQGHAVVPVQGQAVVPVQGQAVVPTASQPLVAAPMAAQPQASLVGIVPQAAPQMAYPAVPQAGANLNLQVVEALCRRVQALTSALGAPNRSGQGHAAVRSQVRRAEPAPLPGAAPLAALTSPAAAQSTSRHSKASTRKARRSGCAGRP